MPNVSPRVSAGWSLRKSLASLGDSVIDHLGRSLDFVSEALTLRAFVLVCLAQVQGLRVTPVGTGHTDRLQRPVGSHESAGG